MNFPKPPKKNLSEDEQKKWNEIMKFFKRHPELLLELMPDDVNFTNQNHKQGATSRKGQSMIPDLGIVPPQSGHLNFGKNGDMMHKRKKSQGDLRKGQLMFNRHQMNPTVAKFSSVSGNLGNLNNSASDANRFKMGTAATHANNEYQTPSFVPNNLLKTVNKTVYKARVAALGSRGKSNSNSNQKDTTILDKKSIIIESDTEEIAQDSQITQSQIVKMQNTINLVSESESEASTKKRSKGSKESQDGKQDQTRTHKRNKTSKLDETDRKSEKRQDEIPENVQEKGDRQLDPDQNETQQKSNRNLKDEFMKEIEEADKSARQKSVSDPNVDKSSIRSQPEQNLADERRDTHNELPMSNYKSSQKDVSRAPSPSNDTSLHNVRAKENEDRKSQRDERGSQQENVKSQFKHKNQVDGGSDYVSRNEVAPVPGDHAMSNFSSIEARQQMDSSKLADQRSREDGTFRRDVTQVALHPQNEVSNSAEVENAETLRKRYEPAKLGQDEGNQLNSSPHQTVFIKQTIESYRDSQHSQKIDEQHMNFSVPVNIENVQNVQNTPEKSIEEVDLDTVSKHSESLKSSEKEQPILTTKNPKFDSKKSVGISVMKSDDGKSQKSVGISVQNTDNLRNAQSRETQNREVDTRSKKSIAISVQNPNNIRDIYSRHTDNRSKKSVSIAVDPDQAPDNLEMERRTPEKRIEPKEERKETPGKTNEISTKQVSTYSSKRHVALSVNPDKIARDIAQASVGVGMSQPNIPEENEESRKDAAMSVSSSRLRDYNNRSEMKSRKSVALSISTAFGAKRDRNQSVIEASIHEEDEHIAFKPFIAKRDRGLSVITHTPTAKEEDSHHSIALSAITHTPTNKTEKQSENLSALHLSQKCDEENGEKSYRSAALSVIQAYEPKNYIPAPRNMDQALDPFSKYQTDKSINPMVVEVEDRAVTPIGGPLTDKSIGAISRHITDKSIGAMERFVSNKEIGPEEKYMTNKEIGPMSKYMTNKEIDAYGNPLTDKSIGPISDRRVDRSVEPRSSDPYSREERKRHPSKPKRRKIYKEDSYDDRKEPTGYFAKSKSKKVDHQCQVVHGRDKSESNSSFKMDRNAGNDPYLRDQYTNAFKQDTGNQFRLADRSSTDNSRGVQKRFKVDEDLTIQINMKNDESVKIYPKYDTESVSRSTGSSRMDKQIQVRHGEHVELRNYVTKETHRRPDRDDDHDRHDHRRRRSSKNHRKPSNKRNQGSNTRDKSRGHGRNHHYNARKHANREERKEYSDSESQYDGGEAEPDISSNTTVRFNLLADEKSRSEHNSSAYSAGVQADFNSTENTGAFPSQNDPNEAGVQAEFSEGFSHGMIVHRSDDNGVGTQADFSEPNAAGVQADFSESYSNGVSIQADISSSNAKGCQADFYDSNDEGVQADFSSPDAKAVQASFSSSNGIGVQANFSDETGVSLNYEGESINSSKILEAEETEGSLKENVISHSFDSDKEMAVEISADSEKDMSIELDFGSAKESRKDGGSTSNKEPIPSHPDSSQKQILLSGTSQPSAKESIRSLPFSSKEGELEEEIATSGKEVYLEIDLDSDKEEIGESDINNPVPTSSKELYSGSQVSSRKEHIKETDSLNSGKQTIEDIGSSEKEEIAESSFYSGKEERKETSNFYSEKEEIKHGSQDSEKLSSKEYDFSSIGGSEKQEYGSMGSLAGSEKEHKHTKGSLGSSKEQIQDDLSSLGSQKESYKDTKSLQTSEKELMEIRFSETSEKEIENRSSALSSQKEEIKSSHDSLNSIKEDMVEATSLTSSRKDEFVEVTVKTGSEKDDQLDISYIDSSDKEDLKDTSIRSGSGKEQFYLKSIGTSSGKEELNPLSSLKSGSGKENHEISSLRSGSGKEMQDLSSLGSGSGKEQIGSKSSISASRKETPNLDEEVSENSQKEVFQEESSLNSEKERFELGEEGTSLDSGKDLIREQTSEDSGKQLPQEGSSLDSGKQLLDEPSSLNSGKDLYQEVTSFGSDKEEQVDDNTLNSGKEYLKDKTSTESQKEHFIGQSDASSKERELSVSDIPSSKERPVTSNSPSSKEKLLSDQNSSKERPVTVDPASSKETIPEPEGNVKLSSSSDKFEVDSINQVDLEEEPEESNSSKEDPRLIQEVTEDSLESKKELVNISIKDSNDSDASYPRDREFKDVAIGMSDITISNEESEESNVFITPSPTPVFPSPQPTIRTSSDEEKLSVGSSKETHHIIIEEEYTPSESVGSRKEILKEESSGSSKESIPVKSTNSSHRIIEIEFAPSGSGSQGKITQNSQYDNSAKEPFRPESDQIRLKNYSEFTNGSSKERYVTEIAEESDKFSDVTMGSEKEGPEMSSVASNKEILPMQIEEVSSFGSAKEELIENSRGSKKEPHPTSSQEKDSSSGKSNFFHPQPSEEIELSFKDIDDTENKTSSKETLIRQISEENISIEGTDASLKEDYMTTKSSGSSKEHIFPPSNSNGSAKEFMITQSEDADFPSLDPISGSEKELQNDKTVSEIRIRYDPAHPERGFIDKRSFWSASANYVEITSDPESEMDTHESQKPQNRPAVDFYQVENSTGSEKEAASQESYGSKKELILDPIEEKSQNSSKEPERAPSHSEPHDYQSRVVVEESEEEDDVSSKVKSESLSSH